MHKHWSCRCPTTMYKYINIHISNTETKHSNKNGRMLIIQMKTSPCILATAADILMYALCMHWERYRARGLCEGCRGGTSFGGFSCDITNGVCGCMCVRIASGGVYVWQSDVTTDRRLPDALIYVLCCAEQKTCVKRIGFKWRVECSIESHAEQSQQPIEFEIESTI